ncbi:hypothetical protein HGRIS_004990 [Hohenbuehelia grisea]|uniref:ZW10 C-terminal helical domain-containing protein n=1 Tax=Hohenbuehelia grisea TaxID=104357 RepID=A0ABR3JDM1_9AGAR
MAFPIPAHLPRKNSSRDVTSSILNKLDEATGQTLNASLAASWLTELDESIRSTKQSIHDRIHDDLPNFERQLQSSQSVQTRLALLKTNVDALGHTVSNDETGFLPTLLRSLTEHSQLATESADASTNFEALSHLLRCKTQYVSLQSFVLSGKLPDAVKAGEELNRLIGDSPIALQKSQVMVDLKRKYRAAIDRTGEQSSEAYSRSILVTATEINVRPSVQVRQSETVLPLREILQSLSPDALANHLATLRRDLTTHGIVHILKQPISVSSDTKDEHVGTVERLIFHHTPPNDEALADRLEALGAVLKFLSETVFPYLPTPHSQTFLQSLCKPITASLLEHLLVPSLPSSFALLPPFVELTKKAVDFESRFIIDLLGADPSDKPIQTWVDGLGGHYERQRRKEILQRARVMIVAPEDHSDQFSVEIEMVVESALPGIVPVQEDEESLSSARLSASSEADDAWGLDDSKDADAGVEVEVADGSGWGFDDDISPMSPTSPEGKASKNAEDLLDPAPVSNDDIPEDAHATSSKDDVEPDPSDAWGWNDDDAPADEGLTDESAWDDPWGEDSSKSSPEAKNSSFSPEQKPIPALSLPAESPKPAKVAKRLEKFSSKHKKSALSSSVTSSPLASSPLGITSLPSPEQSHVSPQLPPPETAIPKTAKPTVDKRPPNLAPVVTPRKETYRASGRMKHIVKMVGDVIYEGKIFAASGVLPNPSALANADSRSAPGTLLLQSAPSILDLFRAVYPIKFSDMLADAPGRAMRFSNDLLYLSSEVKRLADELTSLDAVKEKLVECHHRLQLLGDSWYEDTVEKHRQLVDSILADGADGFVSCSEQDRYDECESAVNKGLQTIRRLRPQWKDVLTKSKYYSAVGLVTDAALSRVLQDVLALPDITEAESHRLSELCRILHALEGLFVEDPNEPSFIVGYVPSWLKFSYLSELLEASMADITYLFEEGALVDFETEELVQLVRALFADTPLRTATITKLHTGHPTSES